MSTDTIITYEAELALRLSSHDATAIDEVLDRYGDYVYWFFLKATYEHATAEDLRQELMLRIWRRASQFDLQKGSLTTWVLTIARNILVDQKRAASTRREKLMYSLDDFQRFSGSGVHLSSWAIESAIEARNALESLPQHQKEILRLFYFDGYTHEEVAELVQRPIGTIKSTILTGLVRLRKIQVSADSRTTSLQTELGPTHAES